MEQVGKLVQAVGEGRMGRRAFMQRALGLGLTFGSASALLAACGGGSQSGTVTTSTSDGTVTPSGGTLTFRGASGVGNLDPGDWANGDDFVGGMCIFEGLVNFKPGASEWELENRLAETFEPSSDGLRYAFTVKQGVQFHDGYGELTAEDVKFSYERLASGDHAYSSEFSALKEVKLEGKYKGVIVLKEPYAPMLASVLPWIPGHIVSKKAIEKLGKRFATNPIGTGPYQMKRSVPTKEFTLERFADWHGDPAPEWDEIRVVAIADDTAARNAYTTGAVDTGRIPLSDVDRFEQDGKLTIERRVSLNYAWIGMNTTKPSLSNAEVRRAIRQAIDVPSILEAAFDGKWERANQLLAPGMPFGQWADAPTYDADPELAKSMLAKAGVSGLKLQFSAYTTTASATVVGEIVQANLADIGIDVAVVRKEFSVAADMPDTELFYLDYEGTAPDPNSSTKWFACDQTKIYNIQQWCDRRYSDLDTTAAAEPDEGRRATMYQEMMEIMDDQAPCAWIAWPAQYIGTKTGVKPSLLPDGTPILWNYRAASR